MKKSVLLVTPVLALLCSFGKKKPLQQADCTKRTMKRAWVVGGVEESFIAKKGMAQRFLIVVDTNKKAKDFVSTLERYYRIRMTKDSTELRWDINGWDTMSIPRRILAVEAERASAKTQADELHGYYNKGQQQVYILNNSKDTVSVQIQDGAYICIIQAKAEDGQWLPVQYWWFSWCGNSYYQKDIPPKTARSFISELPAKGSYKTQLRYKLLGKDKFYYSNEFYGSIDPCAFIDDTVVYTPLGETEIENHYKLDSVINLLYSW